MSAPHIAHLVLSRNDVLCFRAMIEDLPPDVRDRVQDWLANYDAPDVLRALFADQPLPPSWRVVLDDRAEDREWDIYDAAGRHRGARGTYREATLRAWELDARDRST